MSAYFSYLIDELAEIEERLCEADLAPLTAALRRAISQAYVQALLAERTAKLAVEAAAEAANIDEQAQQAA